MELIEKDGKIEEFHPLRVWLPVGWRDSHVPAAGEGPCILGCGGPWQGCGKCDNN